MANKNEKTKKGTSTKNTANKQTVKKVEKIVETKKAEVKKTPTKTVTTVKAEVKKTPAKKVETKVETKKAPAKKVETKKIEVKKETSKKDSLINFIKMNSRNIILGMICILLVINIVLIVTGHKVKLNDGKEVIASIDGKEITAEELFESFKGSYGNTEIINIVDKFITDKEITNDKEANEKAQEQLDAIRAQYESAGSVWTDVLTQYGYDDESVLLKEFIATVKKELVARSYIKKDVTDAEINSYYSDKIYGNYTVKHILITPDTTDEMTEEETATKEAEAKVIAEEVIAKLNSGSTWASLVTEYSDDEGSKDEEGLIENFTYGDMDDSFFKASVALEKDKYSSEPVKSKYGYHIILKISETEKPALKDKKSDIIESIIDNKLTEDTTLFAKTWVNIRKSYNLSFNDTIIKKAYETSINE